MSARIFSYEKENGQWVKKPSTKLAFDAMTNVVKLLGAVSVSYEAYTFSGGKYVLSTDGELGGIDAKIKRTVKMEGGKLSEMRVESRIKSGDRNVTITTPLAMKYDIADFSLPIIA